MPPDALAREREWEKHKIRIWHLLHHEKLPPDRLRDHMRALGFNATLQEYRDRCKEWGIPRTIPREITKHITHRIEKRKRENKQSAVVVAGIRWTDQRTKKETCRNFYTTQELITNPNPSTPPGAVVSVCSPTPIDIGFSTPCEWPSELPWLRFNRLLENSPDDILGNMVQQLFGASREPSSQSWSVPHGQFDLQRVSHSLGLLFRHSSPNPLKLSNHLRRTMPETFSGEHLVRSQLLAQHAEIAAPEFLRLAFYKLSNNDFGNGSCGLIRDDYLLDLATCLGLKELTQGHMNEPTISSILDKVWSAALRRGRSKIVARLLKRHFRVHLPCHCPDNREYHWPLTVVLRARNRDCFCRNRNTTSHPATLSDHDLQAVIHVLLAAGASPDASCCTSHRTPMEEAINSGWLDITRCFVEHGIRTRGQDYLLGLDFEKLFLSVSSQLDMGEQRAWLGYLQSFSVDLLPTFDPYGSFLCPEGLTRAAKKGCLSLLTTLCERGANFNCQTPDGHFPLGELLIASKYDLNQTKHCNMLVNYQPVTPTGENYPSALHIASCYRYNEEVLTFLLESGATTHTPARFPAGYLNGLEDDTCQRLQHVKTPLSPLELALWLDNHENAIELLKWGAPVRGHEARLLFHRILQAYHHDRMRLRLSTIHLLKALVSQGATLGLVSDTDKTVLDIAVLLEWRELASYLIQIGAPRNTSMPLRNPENPDQGSVDDWLDQFGALQQKNDFSTTSLDDWFQLHPYKADSSHHALLDAVVCRMMRYKYHHQPLDYVLQRCPQAYSSDAVWLVLARLEPPHLDRQFATLHELVKRRCRNDFTDDDTEHEIMNKLISLSSHTTSAELLSILELAIPQQADMDPDTIFDTPLLIPYWQEPPSHPFITSFGEMRCLKPVLNTFNRAGFRPNTLVGLVAVSKGFSTTEVQHLIDAGFDPRKRYHWSHTTLQYAVLRKDIQMVRFLLSQGADVNGRPSWTRAEYGKFPLSAEYQEFFSSCGRSALQLASETGNFECIELLVHRGADINAPAGRVGGGTALQLAAARGYIGIVKWLIDQGAEILAPGSYEFGATAIEGAAMNGSIDIVGLLLAASNFENGEGRSQCIRAIGYARASGHQMMASYMEHYIGWSTADEEALDQERLINFKKLKHYKEKFCSDTDCDCRGEGSVDEGIDGPSCWRNRFESPKGSNDSELGSLMEDPTSRRMSDVFDDNREEARPSAAFGPAAEPWEAFVDFGSDTEDDPPFATSCPATEPWEAFVAFGPVENRPSTDSMDLERLVEPLVEEFLMELMGSGADSIIISEETGDDETSALP